MTTCPSVGRTGCRLISLTRPKSNQPVNVRHMFEGAEVVRPGVFFYDGAVACDVRIVKHNWRYGSGDYEDPPEVRDDVEGEFFYIQYGSTTERGKYVAGSGPFPSVEEAVGHAERSLSGVSWLEKQ